MIQTVRDITNVIFCPFPILIHSEALLHCKQTSTVLTDVCLKRNEVFKTRGDTYWQTLRELFFLSHIVIEKHQVHCVPAYDVWPCMMLPGRVIGCICTLTIQSMSCNGKTLQVLLVKAKIFKKDQLQCA